MSSTTRLSASGVVKANSGTLRGIIANLASTITIYNDPTGANGSPILGPITLAVNTNLMIPSGIGCSAGIYAVLSGTPNATFIYD